MSLPRKCWADDLIDFLGEAHFGTEKGLRLVVDRFVQTHTRRSGKKFYAQIHCLLIEDAFIL
jgi:hypothetical protein